MTFAELYDQVAGATGDKSSEQRANARRWLNLTRSHIADEHFWPSALDASATFTASSGSSTGVFTIGTSYDHVSGDWMFNATDNDVIVSEGLALAQGIDVDKSTTGPPTVWAPAGMDTNGNYQVYLWPIPSATTTVNFIGVKRMTSLSASNDSDTIDPYFGDIQAWSACFASGMRFYAFDTDNEDAFSVNAARSAFFKSIAARKKRASVGPHSTAVLADVKRGLASVRGRLDPSAYPNV